MTATNSDGTSQALSAATATIVDLGSAPGEHEAAESVRDRAGRTDASASTTAAGRVSSRSRSATSGRPAPRANPVCTNLAGATGQSYQISTSQVGSLLRATVTATNSLGNNSAFSNLTTVVIAKATAPINTSLPDRSPGTASVGQTLQATTGTWTGVATNGFGYQWSRCNADGTTCASISGATGQSYGVGQADLGLSLRVTVTATNPTGSTSATSAAQLIAAPVVLTAQLQRRPPAQPGSQPPEPDIEPRRRTLHREGHRQDAHLDAHVLAPERPPDRRHPQQGRPRRERGSVQVALPPVPLARPRHADADRIPARRAHARQDLRQHPHDQKHPRRDPRPDQPRELTTRQPGHSPRRHPSNQGTAAKDETWPPSTV